MSPTSKAEKRRIVAVADPKWHGTIARIARLRLLYSYIMAVAVVVAAQKPLLWYGLIAVALGMAIRFWAAGHIFKKRKLAMSGPYAFTRNPLYFGSFLEAIGVFVLTHNWWLLLAFLPTYAVFYGAAIWEEERFMTAAHGDGFLEYKKDVPAFLPRIVPASTFRDAPFSVQQMLANHEHRLVIFSLLVPICAVLVAYLR